MTLFGRRFTAASKLLSLVAAVAAGLAGCDDPVPGEIGGVIFMVRTFPSEAESEISDVVQVQIDYDKVEGLHRSPDGDETTVVLDSQPRTFLLNNADDDSLFAQFQVPEGSLDQLRIWPTHVELEMRDGSTVVLDEYGPSTPSWYRSGWKVVPEDGAPFEVVAGELSGVRGLFDFDDRLVHTGPASENAQAQPEAKHWKVKPTMPAEAFQVNPNPGEGGVYMDQVTVVFESSVTDAEITAFNAAIGAVVVIAPVRSHAWRMKIPPTINLEQAIDYYKALAGVRTALPGIDYGPEVTLRPDDLPDYDLPYDQMKLPDAWGHLFDQGLPIGSHAITVGLVEAQIDIEHRDLYQNIWLNQGELPADKTLVDTDGDGLITFVDLNAADNAGQAIDLNGTGYIDGGDLLDDSTWENGVDEDGNGRTDDLVGWTFRSGSNDPRPNDRFNPTTQQVGDHGTLTAGIIGAMADNGQDTAGVSWNVSIVPLIAEVGVFAVPDATFQEMVIYAEEMGLDLVNVSQGWHLASKDAEFLGCAIKGNQTDKGIPPDEFEAALPEGIATFEDPRLGLVDADGTPVSKTLYVFSAGNSAMDLSDDDIVAVPKELMQQVVPGHVLIVGNAATRTANYETSDYGAPVVDVWAPGLWHTLEPGDSTDDCVGTSCAAPAVAGLGALVLANRPDLRDDPPALREHLRATSMSTLDVTCGDDVVETDRPHIDADAAVR